MTDDTPDKPKTDSAPKQTSARPGITVHRVEPTAAVNDQPHKPLSPAAQRALAEAEARRKQAALELENESQPKEINGQAGPEPTRFGDWEKKGIISDF